MKVLQPIGLLLFSLVLAGCASLRIGGEFQSGRQALLKGNDDTALAYFQSVARQAPDYAYGTAFRQGIFSYLGRTEYATGRCQESQEALKRALSTKNDNELARLYYGLSLVCAGERDRGLTEIRDAMQGLHRWLDYINEAHRFSFGQFWDPGRDIRSAIETQLASLSPRGEGDVKNIVAGAEWLGKRMEEEVDRATDQETRQQSRENSGGESVP